MIPLRSDSPPVPRKGKTILVADDDRSVRFVLEQALSRAGYDVKCFADGRDLMAEAASGDLVFTDIVMPSGSGLDLLKALKNLHPTLPVIVITAQSTLLNAVHAFERGAFEYLAKPFDINQVVALVERALEQSPPPAAAHRPLDVDRFGGIIGSSRAMQELFRTIGRLSGSEMTVLIHGESGTGKERVARAIHAYSPRKSGPFVAINMAAIPRNLIESELFGHEKGAFTGAVARRDGHFTRAQGGTLFLDEIGDMPMEAQTRLLRVLQDGTFTRVGGADTLRGNVRIIAATHQDLPAAIQAGSFREDLFYRLNVIPLHVPPLRQRREDIPLLADYFLSRAAGELKTPAKRLSPECLGALLDYPWPGNVRELENLVQRLMVLVPDEVVLPHHLALPAPLPAAAPAATTHPGGQMVDQSPAATGDLREAVLALLDRYFTTLNGLEPADLHALVLRQVEDALFTRVLKETRGNQIRAAQMLGINRNTLRKKLRELGIAPKG